MGTYLKRDRSLKGSFISERERIYETALQAVTLYPQNPHGVAMGFYK